MWRGKIVIGLFALLTAGSLTGFFFWSWSIWFVAAIAVVFSSLLVYGAANVRSNFFIKTISKAEHGNAIAITFDDGPLREKTDRILDILKSSGVQSAFFCIGKNIEQEPLLVKRMHNEGHLVGNHTYFHGKFFDLQSSISMQEELERTNNVVFDILGRRMKLFRPPYGVTNPNLAKAVHKGSFSTIGWSLRSLDTVIRDKEVLWKRITGKLKGGDVVLFHDYCDNTIELLPRFIEYATKSGFKIVRLDTLLKLTPYE